MHLAVQGGTGSRAARCSDGPGPPVRAARRSCVLQLRGQRRARCAGSAPRGPAPIATGGGTVSRQAATASLQRSVNGQPGGRSASSGTVPAIVASRVPGAAPSLGRAANRPCVYGCAMRANTSAVGPLSTTVPPYITSMRATFCGDHAEVVRDQQQRHAALGHQVGDQVEDLALDRHVERRRRLVGDQQVGPAGERHRDRDALALAAGELVRIGVDAPRRVGQADTVEQRDGLLARHRTRSSPLCSRSGSADLAADRVQRVQRRHRLLEDDADAVAAQSAQLGVVAADQFLAVEADAAVKPLRAPAAGPAAPAP